VPCRQSRDVPEFALKVAEAGGLPTIALGLMDEETLDRRLGRLPEVMGGRPYAVNIVSLAENPLRGTHMAWIRKHRPRFVTIAVVISLLRKNLWDTAWM